MNDHFQVLTMKRTFAMKIVAHYSSRTSEKQREKNYHNQKIPRCVFFISSLLESLAEYMLYEWSKPNEYHSSVQVHPIKASNDRSLPH